MSAYIVIEGTVRDKEALGRYGSQATPLIKEFGGEVLAFGPWELQGVKTAPNPHARRAHADFSCRKVCVE